MYSVREVYDHLNQAVLTAQLSLRISDQDLSEILGIELERVQKIRVFQNVITKNDGDSLERALGLVLLVDLMIDIYDQIPGTIGRYLQSSVSGRQESMLTLMKNPDNFCLLHRHLENLVSDDFLNIKRCVRKERLAEEVMRSKFILIDELEIAPHLMNAYPTFGIAKTSSFSVTPLQTAVGEKL